MKVLAFGMPQAGQEIPWIINALRQIERASNEDSERIFDDFTITNLAPINEVRTLDAVAATLPQLVAFVATMVSDLKKRGQNRSLNEV